MTIWTVTTIALLPPLALALFSACRGPAASRLAAVQLATAVTGMVLALMTFAFDQPAFIDLSLSLALLSMPGTLVMALFLERWL